MQQQLSVSIEDMRFLSDASRRLTAAPDVPIILAELAGLVVPSLADWCAVDLLSPGGVFERQIAAPEGVAGLAEEVAAAWASIGHSAADAPTLVIIDERLIYPPPGADGVGAIAALRLPICLRGRTQGAISVARRARPYGQAEVALLDDLAQRVGLALDNAQLSAQAHAAARQRDEFLSIASHELRTPLTSLLGYVQLLDRRLRHSGDVSARDQRAVQVIVSQTLRLNTMISTLLDVSRLQSGRYTPRRAPIDLSALIERAIEEISLPLDRHTITHQRDTALPPLVGDELRIYQVLQILLQNAVSYSPGGGEISVRARAVAGCAEVVISDAGIGIPPECLPHLFERFYRASNAEEQRIGGIGMGLYVAHEIVALHGGTIDVNSRLGAGSSFTLRLPLG